MKIWKRSWVWNGKQHHAWRVDWKDSSGRHQRQFRSKIEAELFQEKLLRERHSREYGVLLNSNFCDFLKIYESKKSWRTESYRERVMSALRLMPFTEFPNTESIEAYRDERLAARKAAASVRQDLAAVSDCLKWAVKLKYLRTNPAQEVERPSLPIKQDDPAEYLTPAQFADLLAMAKQDRPLYKFAVWTGLRITELFTLEWTDVREDFVIVRRGKGRKQRIVPLVPQAVAALKEVPRRLNDPRIFWWMRDRHTTLRRFQRRLRWAELPPFRFHDLRHTFGAYAAQSGVDLEVIAQAMGHTSTTVTKLYAHLSPGYKRKELFKMARFGTRAVHGARKSAKQEGS